MITVQYETMKGIFAQILMQEGLTEEKAQSCAEILANNSRDGVLSHGVNRFEAFADRLLAGKMRGDAEPEFMGGFGGFEQWDGHGGIGPLNAIKMMDRAMALADEHGIGLAAIRNTTHWMRGASYAYHAIEKGYACLCWTNTMPNMCLWNTTTEAIGNNPIVFGIVGEEKQVVLDMAVSQYSYGKLQTLALADEKLPYDGGFDKEGKLTKDPSAILESHRILPAGLWKGSGLSIIGELFTSSLSHGLAGIDMPDQSGTNVSQIFLAIRPGINEEDRAYRTHYVDQVLALLQEACERNEERASYPGEGTMKRRRQSMEEGIAVKEKVWESILKRAEAGQNR